jgi:hypothetical protein
LKVKKYAATFVIRKKVGVIRLGWVLENINAYHCGVIGKISEFNEVILISH